MSVRTLIVMLVAIGCGGVATYGVFDVVLASRSKGDSAAILKTVRVVVSSVDIGLIGTKITEDMVELQEWPEDLLPDGVIYDKDLVVDQTLRVPVMKGELILSGKYGAGGGMAAIIDPGYRAFTIHTPSHSSGVAGFVMPGDTVDVLLTLKGDEKSDVPNAKTLLQNVKVLASDQMINAPEKNTIKMLKSVTLSVSPQQGLELGLAQSLGTLALMLRNKEDNLCIETSAITANDFGRLGKYAEEQVNSPNQDGPNTSDGRMGDVADASLDGRFAKRENRSAKPALIRTLRGLSPGEIYVPRVAPYNHLSTKK